MCLDFLLKNLDEVGFFLLESEAEDLQVYFKKIIDLYSISYTRINLLASGKVSYGNTLSKIYGSEKFPFHTDGAQYLFPPRFIALIGKHDCINKTSTYLIDSLNIKAKVPHIYDEGLFKLRGNGFCVYTGLVSYFSKNLSFFRYNPIIMSAVNKEIGLELNSVIDGLSSISFNLNKNSCLLIDNWRILHGRSALIGSTCKRMIERYEFYSTQIQ